MTTAPGLAGAERPAAPPGGPLLVRRGGAAALCGMGVSTFDRADAAGLLPGAIKLGGCKLWCAAELAAWAARGCPPRAQWEPIWRALLTRTK
jgi:predicted DNA-binding transcriptional regulator AlpA